jgi:hypothetical protein
MSSYIKCPHCHTLIPDGARICTGCGAEKVIEPGDPVNVFKRIWYGFGTSVCVMAVCIMFLKIDPTPIMFIGFWIAGALIDFDGNETDKVFWRR